MFKKFFSRRSKRNQEYDTIAGHESVSVSNGDDNALKLKVNLDGFSEKEKEEFYSTALDRTEHTRFEGHVEHAYATGRVGHTNRCPRCRARTQQQYGQFIYATQIALRAMFAPAGFFCTQCPSVIIDEDMIKAGIADRKCKYQGVVGLEPKGRKNPEFFKTWNGKDTFYIVDEDGMNIGTSTLPVHTPQSPARNALSKRKNRRKTARKSRKTNRK